MFQYQATVTVPGLQATYVVLCIKSLTVHHKTSPGSPIWTISLVELRFYPRDAMHSSVFATATCLSVRPSVTAGVVSS